MNFINQNYMEHNMFQNSNSFKCSSYIDACKQYEFNQSIAQNPHLTGKKQKSNRIVTNVKKMRQAISKKLKKLININNPNDATTMTTRTPANTKLNQTATIRRSAFKSRTSLILSRSASSKRTKHDESQNIVQLVNYKYNGSSNYDLTMLPNTPRVVPKRLRYNRYSDGVHSTSSSSSSLASAYSSYQSTQPQEDSEQFRSAEITHLFTACASTCQVKSASMKTMYHQQQLQQQSNQVAASFVSSQMQTSTPVQNKTRSISQRFQYNYEIEQPSIYAESLFDNQTEDLVVMKKPSYVNARALNAPPPIPSQVKIIESHKLVKQAIHQTLGNESKSNWNLLVINKFHNDTNATFNTLPEWAVGNELNLAVVNQLYYNPNGNGIFNKQPSGQL